MSKVMLSGVIVLVSLMLAACTGSTIVENMTGQLTFQLTTAADSAVDPGNVSGEQVQIAVAIAVGGPLPTGFTPIQGMHIYPELPPDSGFRGTLSVRLSQISTGQSSPGYDSSLLYLYYMNPVTGEAGFVDSSRATGEWVNFQVGMLGYFVVASNDSIPNSIDTFAAFAFADMAAATIGVPINFWAVAINGAAPYTFSWSLGDGTELSGDSLSHSYSATGEFNVRVTITDATGLSTNAYSTPISITADGAPVLDSITVTQSTADFQTFTYEAAVSGGAPPYTYEWDFDGDGSVDLTKAPPIELFYSFNYLMGDLGFFAGTLAVTDAIGQTVIGNYVTDARILQISTEDISGPVPHTAEIDVMAGGSRPGETVVVYFGDGTSTSEVLQSQHTTVVHTYESAGDFTVSATVTATVGTTDYSVDSNDLDITVQAAPTDPYLQLTQPIVPFFGQDLTLYGYNFGATQGSQLLMLADLELSIIDWSDTAIRFEFPADFVDGQGQLAISDGTDIVGNSITLTVEAEKFPISVQNVIPQQVEPGGRLLIIGHGFGRTPVAITLGSATVNVDAWDGFAIIADLVGSIAPGEQQLVLDFSPLPVTVPVQVGPEATVGNPVLTAATPIPFTTSTSDPLTLTGGGFSTGEGGLVFSAGFVLPADSWNDTEIILADILPDIDSFAFVLNHQRCSNPLDIRINGAPRIEELAPPYGSPGDFIHILGHSFGNQAPGDRVTLGGVALSVSEWTPNAITVELPADITDGDMVVEKSIHSNPVPFDVIPATPGPPNGEQI